MATKLRDSGLSEASAADMRAAMIDSQLRTSDVIDPAVVAAMASVAREDFAPPALAGVAYMDRAIPLGGGRMMNAPLVTGRMLVAAQIAPGMRVLLVGAACGYTAALLAQLGATVTALESDPALSAAAQQTSAATVDWVEGNLAAGAADKAPFDRILIEGAIDALPQALSDQLVEGGRLVAAIRDGAVSRLALAVKTAGTVALRPFADMDVAPLPGFAAPAGFRF